MKALIKDALKILIKRAIPKQLIIDAIIRAERLKDEGMGNLARFKTAVDIVVDGLPLPLNILADIALDVIVEAVSEAVQETFDDIKSALDKTNLKAL